MQHLPGSLRIGGVGLCVCFFKGHQGTLLLSMLRSDFFCLRVFCSLPLNL